MRHIIQYTLPYEHKTMVGIEAESREAVIAKAGELFDQGDISQDSAEVPLLYDDFEEQGDAGVPHVWPSSSRRPGAGGREQPA